MKTHAILRNQYAKSTGKPSEDEDEVEGEDEIEEEFSTLMLQRT